MIDTHLTTSSPSSAASGERLSPDSSPPEHALEFYVDRVNDEAIKERSDFLDHSRRVAEIVHTYADGLVAPATYHAALLHDLVDRFRREDDDSRRAPAAVALYDYLTNPSTAEIDANFALHLMADMTSIEAGAEKYRGLDYGDVDFLARMHGEDKSAIPDKSQIWAQEIPLIDIDNLSEQAKWHNMEAIIIKAAEEIDNLMNPAPNDTSLLQDIVEAETFYAPLCEVFGLDAMAMKLRTEATKRRYEKLGKHDLLRRATEIQREALESGIEDTLPSLFGSQRIDYDYAPNATRGTSEHPVFYSGTIVGGPLDGCEVRMRVKSIGSIIKKIESLKDNLAPLDIFAITVISGNHEESAEAFVHTLKSVETSLQYDFKPAPGKKMAIYAQGSDSYKNAMQTACAEAGFECEVPTGEYGYAVARCTGTFTTTKHVTGFEVQFLDAKTRKDARIGMQAHVIFKMIKYSGVDQSELDFAHLVALLEQTNDRRDHVDKSAHNVNKRSTARAEQLVRDIENYFAQESVRLGMLV